MQSYLYINDIYAQVTQTNQFQNLDTLNVTQLNYTVSSNIGYVLQNAEERRQNVNVNLMYQKSAEAQKYSKFAGNDIYNAALSYQFSLVPTQFSASTTVNYNYNHMPDDQFTQAMTYNLTLQKNFFKVLRSSISTTYSNMNNQDGRLSDVLNLRLSGGYTLAKRHNFNLSATTLYTQLSVNNTIKTRTQYAINLSYAYSFNTQVARKDKKWTFEGGF